MIRRLHIGTLDDVDKVEGDDDEDDEELGSVANGSQ